MRTYLIAFYLNPAVEVFRRDKASGDINDDYDTERITGAIRLNPRLYLSNPQSADRNNRFYRRFTHEELIEIRRYPGVPRYTVRMWADAGTRYHVLDIDSGRSAVLPDVTGGTRPRVRYRDFRGNLDNGHPARPGEEVT